MSIAGEVLANEGSRLALITKSLWSFDADVWLSDLPNGERFTSEDLIDGIGLPDSSNPNSNNAVGAKIRTWSHNRMVERVGFEKTRRVSSHARMIALWEKL
jgi:hypothetical protein